MITRSRVTVARFGFTAILMCSAVVAAKPARADDCDATIDDAAGIITSGTSDLNTAIARLERLGAVVRVRTMRTFGSSGSLDRYKDSVIARCPSWQSPGGGARNSIIIAMIAMEEREVGLFAGEPWVEIASRYGGKIRGTMGPQFAAGRFGEGFAQGLEQLADRIDELNAPARPPASAPVIVQVPSAPVITTAPTDLSGLWTFLGWLLVIAVGCGLIYVFLILKKGRERRAAAQRKAKENRRAAAQRIADLSEALPILGVKVHSVASKVDADTAKRVRDRFAALDRQFSSASSSYTDLSTSVGNPDDPKHSERAFRDIADANGRVVVDLQAIDTERHALEEDVDTVLMDAERVTGEMDAAKAAIDSMHSVLAEIEAAGWKTDGDPAMFKGKAEGVYREAEAHRSAKRFAKAIASAEGAKRLAADAERAATGLVDRKQHIEQGIRALEAQSAKAPGMIESAREVFGRVQATYAESSWDDIAGNGSRAEDRLDGAHHALDEARRAVTMDEQRWADAEQQLAAAVSALDDVANLTDAITKLEQSLIAAQASVEQELRDAEADIDRAAAYEREHDADIDDREKDEIRSARETLLAAGQALAQELPDYLEVVRLAREANHRADKILERCHSEHEAAERLRKRAKQSIGEAADAIERAERYVRSNRADVERSVNDTLSDADGALRRAKAAHNPTGTIAAADEAKRFAGKAHKDAQEDVRHAHARREEERRRREHEATVAAEVVVDAFDAIGRASRAHRSFPSPTRSRPAAPRSPSPISFPNIGGGSSPFGSLGGGKIGGGSSKW